MQDVLTQIDVQRWQIAINDELNSLKWNKTWELTPLPLNKSWQFYVLLEFTIPLAILYFVITKKVGSSYIKPNI
jgi:hypothetical protein